MDQVTPRPSYEAIGALIIPSGKVRDANEAAGGVAERAEKLNRRADSEII